MRTNERGNEIYNDFEADKKLGVSFVPNMGDRERYYYDFHPNMKDWKQFDTNQDAWYFGVWVNIEQRMMFTYAEGDRILVVCPTLESFRAELQYADEFYGPLPACATAIDADGSVTKYYDARPTV